MRVVWLKPSEIGLILGGLEAYRDETKNKELQDVLQALANRIRDYSIAQSTPDGQDDRNDMFVLKFKKRSSI